MLVRLAVGRFRNIAETLLPACNSPDNSNLPALVATDNGLLTGAVIRGMGTMTAAEFSILVWAIPSLIVVPILLRFPGRRE